MVETSVYNKNFSSKMVSGTLLNPVRFKQLILFNIPWMIFSHLSHHLKNMTTCWISQPLQNGEHTHQQTSKFSWVYSFHYAYKKPSFDAH